MDGSQVVAVKDLGLDYNVFQLITKGLSVDNIRLEQAGDLPASRRRHLVAQPAGQEAGAGSRSRGPAYPIAIDAIEHHRRLGRRRRAGRDVGRRGAEAVRSPRREAVVQVRAGALLDRDHARVVPRLRAGAGPQRAVGRRAVRDDTLFVEKLALRTAEDVAVGGRRGAAVSDDAAVSTCRSRRTSCRCRRSRGSCRRWPACTLQPAFELKLDGPLDRLERRDERPLVGRPVIDRSRDRRGRPWTPGQSVAGRRLGAAPRPRADPEGPAPEERHHRRRARRSARPRRCRTSTRCAARASIDSPRIVAAGYAAEPIHAKARIDGRRVALDGSASAYGAAATVAGNVDAAGQAKDAPVALRRSRPWRGTSICGGCRASLKRAARRHRRQCGVSRRRIGHGPERAGRRDRQRRSSLRAVDDRRRDRSPPAAPPAFAVNGEATSATRRRDRRRPRSAAPRHANSVFPRWRPIATRARSTATSSPTGAARRRKTMDLTASGTLTDSTILGGTNPAARRSTRSARRATPLHVKAVGTFAGFDPAVASGKPELKGTVGGTARRRRDGRRTSRRGVTPDSVQADAKIDAASRRPIGGLDITRAQPRRRLPRLDRRHPRRSRSPAATSTSRRAARWR